MDVTDIIELMGGTEALAADMNVRRQTVLHWHSRGFPSAANAHLWELAKQKGLHRATRYRKAKLTLEMIVTAQTRPQELRIDGRTVRHQRTQQAKRTPQHG